MMNLKGTEKQIAWAEQIREKLVASITEETIPQIHHLFTAKTVKAQQFIENLGKLRTTNSYLNNQIVIHQVRELIENEENAKTFIDNQSLMSFIKIILT